MAKDSNPRQVIIKKIVDGGHAAAHGGSWKVAYADFVTALMALFLLLWLLAALKPTQKDQIALVFKDKPSTPKEKVVHVARPTYVPKNFKEGSPDFKLSQDQKLLYEIALKVKELITEDPNMRNNAGVSADNAGVLLQIDSNLLFEAGSAKLRPEAEKALMNVVKILKQEMVDLVVRGHADDIEAKGSQFPTKWELSSARAVAALRFILDKGGISPKRLRATGYADTHPLVPPLNPESLAKNRRVEFFYHSPGTETW